MAKYVHVFHRPRLLLGCPEYCSCTNALNKKSIKSQTNILIHVVPLISSVREDLCSPTVVTHVHMWDYDPGMSQVNDINALDRCVGKFQIVSPWQATLGVSSL